MNDSTNICTPLLLLRQQGAQKRYILLVLRAVRGQFRGKQVIRTTRGWAAQISVLSAVCASIFTGTVYVKGIYLIQIARRATAEGVG